VRRAVNCIMSQWCGVGSILAPVTCRWAGCGKLTCRVHHCQHCVQQLAAVAAAVLLVLGWLAPAAAAARVEGRFSCCCCSARTLSTAMVATRALVAAKLVFGNIACSGRSDWPWRLSTLPSLVQLLVYWFWLHWYCLAVWQKWSVWSN
jgi:hypothetical protein